MGVLLSILLLLIRNYGYTIPGYDYDAYVCSVPYITLTANTVRQQGVTHGNHVGYSEVTELLGENGENGKIIHGYRVLSILGGGLHSSFSFKDKSRNATTNGNIHI